MRSLFIRKIFQVSPESNSFPATLLLIMQRASCPKYSIYESRVTIIDYFAL